MQPLNSQAILDHIENWAKAKNFSAPYGILTNSRQTKSGRKYLTITFGRPRTLDATVEIYNRNFLILRTSRHGSQVFKNFAELQSVLETL